MMRPKIVNWEIASFLLILSKFLGILADIFKDIYILKKIGM